MTVCGSAADPAGWATTRSGPSMVTRSPSISIARPDRALAISSGLNRGTRRSAVDDAARTRCRPSTTWTSDGPVTGTGWASESAAIKLTISWAVARAWSSAVWRSVVARMASRMALPRARPAASPPTPMIIRRPRRLNRRHRPVMRRHRATDGPSRDAAGEPVSRAANGLDGLRTELAPQISDVDLDEVGLVGVEDPVEQLRLGDDLTGVAHQVLQQRELPDGQAHVGVGHGHPPRGRV